MTTRTSGPSRHITGATISEIFLERVRLTPDTVGFQFKPTDPERGPPDQWKRATFRDFHEECRQISFGLMSLGIGAQGKGDKVAILSNTRYEWSLADMAILGASAVTVPVYASNTPEDVMYILNHSEARVVFVEDSKQLQKLLDKRIAEPGCLPKLERIVAIEPSAMSIALRRQGVDPAGCKDVLTLQALKELGRRQENQTPTRFDDNHRAALPGDLITICYTSGTTGTPKGAMLTHDNFASVFADTVQTVGRWIEPRGEGVISFLPFSHVIGKCESFAVYVFGWLQTYAENIDKLMTNIADVRPTILWAVPRIFEKAHHRIYSAVEASPEGKRKLFHWAVEAGRRYFASPTPSLLERSEYALAKALVFRKVSARFGGRLRFSVCGGAPLPKEIGEFFRILGIQVLEGYGLTETSAPITLNLPDDTRYGIVGRPLPEVQLKIAADGEILVKSRKVFQGYYKMPKESAECFEQGWFLTGDIGHLDTDGFLHITDRKKDIIVTSGGKNVAPQKIESLAKSQKLINQFVVHGDRRHFLTALVTLDRDQVIKYASEQTILFSEYSELIKHTKIIAIVQKIVDEINSQLASFETIKKFVILPGEFTVDSGELTPSLKVRRGFINTRYKGELDSLYAASP